MILSRIYKKNEQVPMLKDRFYFLGYLILLLTIVGGCKENSFTPPVAPTLLSEGSFISNENGMYDHYGRQIFLHGTNMEVGSKGAADHMPNITIEDYEKASDLGFNVVRFLVFWSAISPEEGSFSESYINNVKERLDWAAQHNLFIIMDMHQDLFGEGFNANGAPHWACDQSYYDSYTPSGENWFNNYFSEEITACFDHLWNNEELQEKYFAALSFMAMHLKDVSNVIGYDIMNEPFKGSFSLQEADAILSEFYAKAAAAIHQHSPNKLIFFEPNNTANAGVDSYLSIPTYANGVYAPHYYHPNVELNHTYDKNSIAIENFVEKRKEEAIKFGVPLFFGEYGGASQTDNILEFYDDCLDIFASNLSGSTLWDYGFNDTSFAIMDSEHNEKPHVSAIVRPYPQAVAGEILDFSFEYSTLVFNFTYEINYLIDQPTVVHIPNRHYPDGINLNGCSSICSCDYFADHQKLYIQCQGPGIVDIQISPK